MSESGWKQTPPGEERDDALARLIASAGRRPEPPELVEAQVRAAVRDEWRRVTDRRRWRNSMIVAAAAVIAFAAVGIGVLRETIVPSPAEPVGRVVRHAGDVTFLQPDGTGIQVGPAPYEERLCVGCSVVTAAGAGVNLLLDDGVSVRIGPATRLDWLSGQRAHLRAGAVYVDAPRREAGKTGPSAIPQLTIETDYGRVAHVGTQYVVMVAPAGLTVRVRDGVVVLDAPEVREFARATEELIIDRQGAITRGSVAPYGAAWQWAEALAGEFDVTGHSVLEFLQWVSHETGRPVVFASEELRREAESAVLRGSTHGLTVTQALDAVMATTRFSASVRDGRLLVTGR